MVDQNSTPQQPSSGHDAQPSKEPAQGMSSPTVVKAGEMMLIFALVLIFLVCLALAIHFYLRRQKRRRRAKSKTKKGTKKSVASAQPELQSQERKIVEMAGTPLCEMGESEPRHEMEDVEVLERHTPINLENPADSPVVVSPLDPDLEAGTMAIDEMTVTTWQPDARTYAVYWSRGI